MGDALVNAKLINDPSARGVHLSLHLPPRRLNAVVAHAFKLAQVAVGDGSS